MKDEDAVQEMLMMRWTKWMKWMIATEMRMLETSKGERWCEREMKRDDEDAVVEMLVVK